MRVSMLDVGEMGDIEKAIELPRRCIPIVNYAKDFEKAPNIHNLRTVYVPDDALLPCCFPLFIWWHFQSTSVWKAT